MFPEEHRGPQGPPGTPPQGTGEAPQSLAEERPNKFVPDSNWALITGNRTGTGQGGRLPGTQAEARDPGGWLAVLTDLDGELGAEDVRDVIGDYLTEDTVAMRDLLLSEPGLTGGESTEILEAAEAMEVDPEMGWSLPALQALSWHSRSYASSVATSRSETTVGGGSL